MQDICKELKHAGALIRAESDVRHALVQPRVLLVQLIVADVDGTVTRDALEPSPQVVVCCRILPVWEHSRAGNVTNVEGQASGDTVPRTSHVDMRTRRK